MYKNWSFIPKNVHLDPQNGKICTFYTKTEVSPKNFPQLYKFGIKTVVLYPKIHIWSRKKQNNCTFYTKNEVFAKKFDQNV